jgi:HlyD family secretion protein
MKRILYGVGMIALAAGAAGGYLWLNPQSAATHLILEKAALVLDKDTAPVGRAAAAAPQVPPTTVTVIAANREQIVESILVNGTIVAREEIMIGPELEGLRIVDILVEEGERVQAGQVLARLDRSMLEVNLAQSDAALARAQAMVAQANSQIAQAEASNVEAAAALERARSLSRNGYTSQEILDQRVAAARSATARLSAAHDGLAVALAEQRQTEAQRRELELRVARTEVKAPRGGIVSRRTGRIGAVPGMSADALFRVISEGQIELEAEVPESRIAALRTGQKVHVDVTGMPTIEGRIRLVPAEVDRVTRLARMRVALPDTPGLRIGQFARGTVEIDRRDAITLPLSAVLFEQNRATVQRVNDGKVETRAVSLGSAAAGRIEIRDGVRAGDRLVLRAGAFLRDGDAVAGVAVEQARAQP